MTDEQKKAYELLGKRRLSMDIRTKYNKTASKNNPTRPYKEILEYLAENYDLLPTERDKIDEEELEQILNQDPDNPNCSLGNIQGISFPLERKKNYRRK